MVQGLSGLAVTCAVVVGIVAWSPGGGDVAGPGPTLHHGRELGEAITDTDTDTAAEADDVPDHIDLRLPPGLRPGSRMDRALLPAPAPRPGLSLAGSYCEDTGYYSSQTPVEPAPNKLYYFTTQKNAAETEEAVYTFAAGTGASVMEKVRTALVAGCGDPKLIKVLASPSTVADEAIVFTTGGDRLPAAMPEAAMPEHLEILRRRFRRRRGVRDRAGETFAFDRHLRDACDFRRRADADQFEQGRRQIAGVNELMAQLALRRDPLWP